MPKNNSLSKKILLSGASGFIGRHLFAKLRKEGNDVIGIDLKAGKIGSSKIIALDLTKKQKIYQFFKNQKFYAFIHLAAKVPKSPDDLFSQKNLLENIISTLSLLESFNQSGGEKFIYASGVTVIGYPQENPVDENHPLAPVNYYTMSKLFAELLCEQFRIRTNKKIISLRISAPYGPGQNPNSVIPFFIQEALASRDIPILGSGKRSQDFVYVSDVVDAVTPALKMDCSGIYNIGSGQTTSTIKLAKIILKAIPQSKSKIVYSKKLDPEEKYRLKLDISKAKRELKYSPKVKIDEGIDQYIKYIRANI